jgi:chromate transporter
VSFGEAFRVWLRVAALSFGGPAGQIAVMHRIIVEEKRWIGEARFLHALGYCTVLPGPEAQQLATYIGWLMHRTPGGVMAGALFVLPGFVSILALSLVYATYGGVGAVAAVFYGLKAAVLAIVAQAVLRVGRKALRNRAMAALAAMAFILLFLFATPFPVVVVGAGLAGFAGARMGLPAFAAVAGEHGSPGEAAGAGPALLDAAYGEALPDYARPTVGGALRAGAVWLTLWLVPVACVLLALGAGSTFGRIAVFFSQMAVVTFGGAYAVLAYVAQQAVEGYGWLRPGEMLDGLGMAETTPGPLIMVLEFVGFMAAYRDPGALTPWVAGTLGAVLATWVTFVPCFLWIFLGAPFIEALRGNRALNAALAAITAAVGGDPQPCRLVRAAQPVPGAGAGARVRPVVRHAGARQPRSLGAGVLPALAGCALAGIALHLAGIAG